MLVWVICMIPLKTFLNLGIFPTYHKTKPIISVKGPMNLEYMTTTLYVFRPTPPTRKHEDYILWLNKVEAKMSEIWKERGIFDLIQLSRTNSAYCQNMLVVSLYIWENTINTF